jgi:glyoxylase-like metal-dependent hydrolase (beta-lactamase superfamily II)
MIIASESAEDWSAPGVYRVVPGVYRIPMPLPEESRLRAVNVYALVEDTGVVLVDSGWALRGGRDRLAASLAAIGAGLGDVRRFLMTHQHRDHYTLAVEIRREFRTPISVGIGEQAGLELATAPGRVHLEAQAAELRRHGAGELADAVLAANAGADTSRFWELPDAWLRPPERIAVGDRMLQALPTPGHTHGHVVFFDSDARLLFAGDHVLPHITPSIGFEPVTFGHPLRDYLASLRLVRGLPDARLLPAHGPVLEHAHPRVDELIAHHERRLDATARLVASGAHTAREVAKGLRWTRRERRLDELDTFNQMLAVLETAAHLDVLTELGRISVSERDSRVSYEVAGPASALGPHTDDRLGRAQNGRS